MSIRLLGVLILLCSPLHARADYALETYEISGPSQTAFSGAIGNGTAVGTAVVGRPVDPSGSVVAGDGVLFSLDLSFSGAASTLAFPPTTATYSGSRDTGGLRLVDQGFSQFDSELPTWLLSASINCSGFRCGIDLPVTQRIFTSEVAGALSLDFSGGSLVADFKTTLAGAIERYTLSGTLLSSTLETETCGDGVLEPGEECEDGNTDPFDGCSPDCLLEGGDPDEDGIPDLYDNCPFRPNADQRDSDGDEIGDACDGDLDGDGLSNLSDPDQDGDTVANADDNCPTIPNLDQANTFGSSFGDACDQLLDPDCETSLEDPLCADADGVNNGQSGDTYAYRWRQSGTRFSRELDQKFDSPLGQCRFVALGAGSIDAEFEPATPSGATCCVWETSCRDELNNPFPSADCDCFDPSQCTPVGDLSMSYEFFSWPASNPTTPLASDTDLLPDQCDNCPFADNLDQQDTDFDGLGDACDPDQDNDGILNAFDDCPLASNPGSQGADLDGDGIGDGCDVCPGLADDGDQLDTDGNGLGDFCNQAEDFDADGWADALDNCPSTENPGQEDLDRDTIGDACEAPIQFTSDGCYAVTDTVGPDGGSPPTGTFSSIELMPGTIERVGPGDVPGIPIGFDFQFYGGAPQSTLDASRNGFIAFPSGQVATPGPVEAIPTPSEPNGFLAAVWTDLNLQRLWYRTDETVPGGPRRFIVEYEALLVGIAPTPSQESLRFQYVLFEDTHEMEIRAGVETGATSARIGVTGIERPDGAAGYQLIEPSGYEISGLDMRFIPQPGLSLQSDGDGIVDCIDTCPFRSSLDQTDSDGDGNGDLCQCGDTEDDGDVDEDDAVLLQNALAFGGAFIGPEGQTKCNVAGPVNGATSNGLRTDCSILDVAVLMRLSENESVPDPQQCAPALP